MVDFISSSPEWFYGVDSLLALIAVLIAGCISYYSFQIFRVVREKKYFYFSAAFFCIALSLVVGAVTNFFLYFYWLKHSALYLKAHNVMLFYKSGFLLQFFFHLSAYMTLIILALKIESRRVMSLLYLFVISSIIIAEQNFIVFYGVSFALMVLYIVPFFYKNYAEHKNKPNTKRVLIAFCAMALSQLCFILSAYSDQAYVLGHISQLFGYGMLLVNFVKVFRG